MTQRPAAEISWFSALCDDDYRFLGVEDPSLKASHGRIVATSRSRPRPMGTTIYCCHQVIRWVWTQLHLPVALRRFWKKCACSWPCVAAKCGYPGTPTGNARYHAGRAPYGQHHILRHARTNAGQHTAIPTHVGDDAILTRFVERGAGINGWGIHKARH